MRSRGLSVFCLFILSLIASGCAPGPIRGKASPRPVNYTDVVPGLPPRDGPNGLRPGVADAHREVTNTDHKDVDRLAMDALEDIETFWKEKLPKYFDGAKLPQLHEVQSWDDQDPHATACGHTAYNFPNAMYCTRADTIAWDRRLVDMLDQTFPPMAIVVVLAHEYGHRVQSLTKLAGNDDPTIVLEQQADCFAGFFIRWVTEGHAPHFQLNTTNGLNTAMAALLWLRDPITTSSSGGDYREDEHGSGFDRVSAFQMGFADGADSCKKINRQEIDKRRAGLPIVLDDSAGDQGDIPIDKTHIPDVLQAMEDFFKKLAPDVPHATVRDGGIENCPNQKPQIGAQYCVATNKITMDIPALAKIGTPAPDARGRPYSFTGDTAAFVIIAARYGLGYLHGKGQPLTGPVAALTAVCLAGAFFTSIAGPTNNELVKFAPGDLDKATSELIFDGIAATDVDGKAIPSGFTRFTAFSTGAIGHPDACFKAYKA